MKHLSQRSIITLALLGANQVLAGGLWITEFGQPTQGRAGAGEEAGNGDATDALLQRVSNLTWRTAVSSMATATGVMLPIPLLGAAYFTSTP